MLADGSWKTQTFKKYNFAGNPPEGGHLHPLMKVREEFRKIFFELGYVCCMVVLTVTWTIIDTVVDVTLTRYLYVTL